MFGSLCDYARAEEHLLEALSISREIGDRKKVFVCHCRLTLVKLSKGKVQEAYDQLDLSITKYEELRGFIGDNDQFKISFSDKYVFPYQTLGALLCSAGNTDEAFFAVELGRARALADLMLTQYYVDKHIPCNTQSWVYFERIKMIATNCTCLYTAFSSDRIFLWIRKTSGVLHFREIKVLDGLDRNLDDFLAKSFRRFCILPEEYCEDRSLTDNQKKARPFELESLADSRFSGEDEEGQEPEPSLSLCCKIIIAPVANLLQGPEILIVPDRTLYKVPFAALSDESGKYLSETFRIRIVPSLVTLNLIEDSPADYHSQTGALIVGDPKVGRVRYKGRLKNISRLPCAGKEAEMIGRLLGVEPLLAEHATKQAVLQRIHSVSLIHFAAHGNAERRTVSCMYS